MEQAYEKAADAVVCALEQGPDKAMNLYNTKKQKKPKKPKNEAGTAEAVPEKTKNEAGTAEAAPKVEENADINSSAEGI